MMGKPIKIPCKEKDCKEVVTYERETVRGFRSSHGGSKTVAVYLTCAGNHTHRYEIDRESA